MSEYLVKNTIKQNIKVRVPGSKSITNRALLLAALGNGVTTIYGGLKSADSEHFLKCLSQLGFIIDENDDRIIIEGNDGRIPCKEASIYVGSAGTAARFLTSMLAMSDGEYEVTSSEQMAKRPMKDLITALEELGAVFEYYGEEYSLPFKVKGMFHKSVQNVKFKFNVCVNIDKSSQFLSALLMTAPMLKKRLDIKLTGNRTAKSYVAITIKMMEQFGVTVVCPDDDNYYIEADSSYIGCEYRCEPDVSAACYFYAMAAVCGITATVKDVHLDSMQGDIRFLDVLQNMGCTICDMEEGVSVAGTGTLKGVSVNMSDFSDQTMTLAAIAPFASGKVVISNVAHIRGQESDRLSAIENELTRMGIKCETTPDGITIYEGEPKPALIETYDDHRIAMAFAVTGLVAKGIRINNPQCCSKTFPEYFEVLDGLTQ